MARSSFQDIIPPDKRSIRSIPVPERRRTPRADEFVVAQEEKQVHSSVDFRREPPPPPPPPRRTPTFTPHDFKDDPIKRGSSWKKVIVILIIACVLVGGAYWWLSRTAQATVTITVKSQSVSVNSKFTASSQQSATSSTVTATTTGSAGLPVALQYQLFTISKTASITASSSGQKYAETKASGSIVVYNAYSSAPQTLVANTRFETPSGLIFRTGQAITVPGKKGTIPGSITVTVTADKTGTSSNIDLSDFSIPGFAGTAMAKTIYARSKTPMTGGSAGLQALVTPDDQATAQSKLEADLKTALVQEATASVPAGFVLPNSAYYIQYRMLPATTVGSGVAQINEQGTLRGFLFNESQLTVLISQTSPLSFSGTTQLTDSSGLQFSLIGSTSTTAWTASTIQFTLTGTATLSGVVNPDTLASDLTGKPRKNLNAILTAYPGVASAHIVMNPFWLTTFPGNRADIKVILK